MKPVVLITGGSRGIGRALVETFNAEGWSTAACATTAEGASRSGATFSFACDVTSAVAVKEGVAAVVRELGRIDVLINNAGLSGHNDLSPDGDDELWHRILGTNLNGTYYMCKQALPHLPDKTGRIINIASVLALKGVPDQTAYCAAKHGVLGFTRALAHAVAPRRITVNAICPGWVRTDMAKSRMKELGLSEQSLEGSVPLGRFVEPEEVAKLSLFLTTSAAAAITGQALSLDGGVTA